MTRPTRFSARAAPTTQPLPLFILYPLFFVCVYLTHFTLLRLPWFWDEAGYYIPAALDFYRTGSLIPHSTLSNAHPPLPSILLAGWWHISGYHIAATRTFLCMVAAAALLGVFRLARLLAGPVLATVVVLLTGLYPVWFAQSSMAHADLFAVMFTLWALSFYFEHLLLPPPAGTGRAWRLLDSAYLLAVAVLFSLAALSKETAIVTPGALAAWELVRLLTERSKDQPPKPAAPSIRMLLALAVPLLPLIAWYLYHRHVTGFMFGNPEFLRYNATANLTPGRVLLSLWHRVLHMFFHLYLWVPVAVTAVLLRSPGLPGRRTPVLTRPILAAIGIVLAGNLLAFSVLGGALLTRYLLPLYPLLLLGCVAVWYSRLRRALWLLPAALTIAGFLAGLFVNPPYSFAPEDNLTYRDFVVLHQQAIGVIRKRYPAATVLTAWPATTELEHPDLGYVSAPVKVTPVDNFTPEQMQRAAADPGSFDVALIFSTKWIPPAGLLNLGSHSEKTDARLYDFHRDMTPQQAAAMLHGEIVWQGQRNGEWAAVLHFPRVVEAKSAYADQTDTNGFAWIAADIP